MSGFYISGFSDEISADFTEQLEVVKSLDMAYIEIRGVNGRNITDHSLEEAKALKKQMDAAGVKVSAIGSPIGKIQIEEDFEPHFDLFKHTVNLAKVFQCSYIRLFSFYVEEGTAIKHREEVIRRLKEFLEHVKGSDIVLLHENEKDIYGDTAERCLDLAQTLDSKHFKLIFDPANFVQCGVKTYPHAFDLLKDHVVYMHIKDALSPSGHVVPAGQGDGHLQDILRSLSHRGYQGFLSLEPHLGHFDGFEALENESNLEGFKENSDGQKFRLAHKALLEVIREAEHG